MNGCYTTSFQPERQAVQVPSPYCPWVAMVEQIKKLRKVRWDIVLA